MKNVLALDLDTKRYDGDALAVRRVNAESESKYSDIERKRSNILDTTGETLHKDHVIFAMWGMIGTVALACIVWVLCLFLKHGTPKESDIEAAIIYKANLSLMFVSMFFFGSLLFCAVLGILVQAKVAFYKRDLESRDVYEAQWALQFGQLEAEHKELFARMKEELALPNTAVEIDAFTYCYRTADGKRKYHAPASKRSYISKAVKIYADSEALFLATESTVFRIPFSDSMKLVRIRKLLVAYGWNKQEKASSISYDYYKFHMNRSCALVLKRCLALRFQADGEEYEVLFPPYEYVPVGRLTGRTA